MESNEINILFIIGSNKIELYNITIENAFTMKNGMFYLETNNSLTVENLNAKNISCDKEGTLMFLMSNNIVVMN